ncbi:hypothetical protein [Kingella kingae]|uniref:Uncharacterized protein n=2 Tax=Kingella kingae TaxID=504 RepID=F5S901_KINKI|nr:hypothetical protein [Kingella kingae]EGK07977.1 hypothetical protein HMPREF0476_1684 [Kingella kingae ATCC 23330]MDK4535061.1 hypothetical protein [Kingella kingae]MDK4541577.1 hypothetical protein [Kingella kingae]UOP02949.1 hypothetical protein LVJ79_10280 [Kingella kingae]SQH24128.1 Uncharacterised protein [Kingella kingae]
MKKPLFILMTSTGLSAHAADLTEAELVGKWKCLTEYPSIHTMILGETEYAADHTSHGEDKILTVVLDKDMSQTLTYRTTSTAKWTLDSDNTVRMVTQRDTVECDHPESVQAALKASSELQQRDNNFIKILQDKPENEADRTLTLQFERLPNGEFKVRQPDISTMRSICRKLEA